MRTSRALFAALAALMLLLAACGNDDDNGVGDDTTTTDAPETTDPPDTTDPDDTTTTTEDDDPVDTAGVSVYFLDGENLKVGYGREVEMPGVASGALEALLSGPNTDDEDLGLTSEIPDDTTLLGVSVDDGQATVDLSGEFEEGGGSLSMNARLAQVVYTVTQFDTVDEVLIHIDGEAVETLGGEGLLIAEPMVREDFEFDSRFEHLTPAILVETPRPGEQVSDSIRVAGRSNTFEAALYFEIVDADGNVVMDETYAMATSGTGTPGDFDETFDLPADAPAEIVLLAYEISARDGSRTGISEVPLSVG